LEYFRERATGAVDTQSALIYVGRLLAALPGEKALVWVTAGTTSNIWTASLQAGHVKVYPLDVHTKIPYEFVATFTHPQTTYEYETEVNNQLLQNMRDVAQETGGELCGTSVELGACIQGVMEDATDYYVLSYETHSRSNKPELRQIRVKVDRQGVTVSARKSVLVDPTIGTAEEKRERIAAALASPMDLPGLRFELLPLPPHQPGQRFMLSLLMRSDLEHLGVWTSGVIDITVVGIVLCGSDVLQHFGEDVHGKVSPKTASDLDRTGLTWTHQIVVATGASAVRLVVRDNTTGGIGSITQTIP